MADATIQRSSEDQPRRVRIGGAVVALVGIAMVAYAAAFIVRNFTHLIELGLDPAHVNVTQDEVRAFSQGLHDYISHAQVNLGGFIAGTGVATAFLGWFGIGRGAAWAWWSVIIVTLTWVLVGGPIHYVYGFGTLAHLGPGYVAIAVLAVGLYLGRPARRPPS